MYIPSPAHVSMLLDSFSLSLCVCVCVCSIEARTASISVDSTDTLDIVKMKILQSLDIAPHEQDVYYHDTLLTDDQMTLAEIGVLPAYVFATP
jgi:hypothetical protein